MLECICKDNVFLLITLQTKYKPQVTDLVSVLFGHRIGRKFRDRKFSCLFPDLFTDVLILYFRLQSFVVEEGELLKKKQYYVICFLLLTEFLIKMTNVTSMIERII